MRNIHAHVLVYCLFHRGSVMVRLHTCDLHEADGRQGTAIWPLLLDSHSHEANTDYLTID